MHYLFIFFYLCQNELEILFIALPNFQENLLFLRATLSRQGNRGFCGNDNCIFG